ncbi:hypothetical protein [Nonomuraea dietziae]|uniref:hypothetical protein n=1 Tax=Nonomuraea dietziae TaxID=65515 RepID=UPI0031E185F9
MPTREEMRYLLDGANTAFDANLSPDGRGRLDAGLRPLVGSKRGRHPRHEPRPPHLHRRQRPGHRHRRQAHHQSAHGRPGDRRGAEGARTPGALPVRHACPCSAARATTRRRPPPTGGLGAHLGRADTGPRPASSPTYIARTLRWPKPVVEGSEHLRAEVVYCGTVRVWP